MADIAELIVALKLKDGLSGGLGNLNSQLKGMQGGLRDVGRGIGQVGSGLDRIATRGVIAAGAGLGYVVTQAASFEDAFAGVVKTVDASKGELNQLNDQIRAMAREMPIGADELARLGEAAGALGVNFQDIDEFIRTTALLGVTTDITSDQAATALGTLGNQLDLTGQDYERFADILVNLGNDGASTESQILGFAERIAAAGNQAGFSTEDILGFSSAMASLGLEAEAGSTAFSLLLNNLTTSIATGGDEVEAFAKATGQSVDDFVGLFKDDASGAIQTFLEELGKLDRFEAAAVLEEAGITGARQVDAVLRLAQGYDTLSDSLTTATSKTRGLSEEAEKKFGTVQSKLAILRNNLNDAAITIGNELLPVIADLSTEFTDFLNTPGAQQGIKDFAKDLASGVKDLVREVKNADFGPLIDTMKGAAAVAKGAFDAFRSLPQPIQQLALAAIVANKATGGGVGLLASGLGNILKGVIKIGFERGSSPANPLFVSAVGGLGGGPAAAGGKVGKGANLLGAAGLAGFALALIAEVGTEVDRTLNPIGHSFNELLSQTKGRPGSSILAQRDLQELSEATGKPIQQLQSEMIPLLEAGNKTWDQVLAEVRAANVGPRARSGSFGNTPESATGSDTVLLREFGGKLDKLATNDVIEHLSRTTEIGLKDVGTSFQTGIKTGLDPVGDIATKILARAEDPKAPPVMAEIKGHLSGLEEIQASYLANGDIKLADKVQTNIDTLHSLIGTVDQERAVTQARAAAAATSDAAMLATARLQSTKIDGSNTKLSTLNSTLAAKRFDPKITTNNNITIPVNLSVNASVIQRQIYTLRTTTGSGGFI